MKTIGLALLAAIALGAAPASAQVPGTPAPGDPIRVIYQIDDGAGPRIAKIQGFWNDLNSERLRLTLTEDGPQHKDVPLDQLVRLEARERSRAAGAGKGALWGGIIGAVSGLALATMFAVNDSEAEHSGTEFLWGPALFGGIGSGTGALIGVAFGAEQWRTVAVIPATSDN